MFTHLLFLMFLILLMTINGKEDKTDCDYFF